jgi:Ca2+/H+ antiporter
MSNWSDSEEAARVAERPKAVNVAGLIDQSIAFELKTETPEERESRLRREEAQAGHELRTKEAEDTHKRRISLWVHVFVMAVVAIAFLASAYIALVGDTKTGLPDKAMGIITAIVAGGVGYITGKGSK